jgi:hypothetical protein
VGAAIRQIGSELGIENPVPVVPVVPEWNVDTLRRRLMGVLPEALMVQRNRSRLAAGSPGTLAALGREAARTGRGLFRLGRDLGRRLGSDG